VYADRSLTVPIAILAAVAVLLCGLGGYLLIDSEIGFDLYDSIGGSSAGGFFLKSVILGTVLALAMAVAWSAITMLLLRQLGGVEADLLGLVRVIGLALIPMALGILLIWADARFALSLIALGAVASLAVIGVLEAVEARPGPAWLATLAGFAVFVIVLAFLGHGTRDLAPGFFAFQ
jgi:hypothetical protein